MSNRRFRMHRALLGLVAVAPGLAGSEGAERILDCSVKQICDAAGNCRPGSVQVTFRTEPVSLKGDGSGIYALSYGEIETMMEAQSPAGPFFWTVGNERDTLLASSETQFLWHQLTFDQVPEATVRFLQCAFRQ